MNSKTISRRGPLTLMGLIIFTGFVLTATMAKAKDVAGSHDNSLIGRFQGATIIRYQQRAFDQYKLITKKITHYGGLNKNPSVAQTLEGKVTKITYAVPAGHSTFEVQSAYEKALKNNGFKVLFQCSDAACGGRDFNNAAVPYNSQFGDNYEDQRYIAARLQRSQGDVYAAIYTARNTTSGGSTHNAIYTQVNVIEIKPQTSKVVVVKADQMAKRITASGRVALYGVYFDSGKAILKPTSKPTLDQIAKLLKKHSDWKILVVGHTDNQGGFEYNIKLSKQRAEAVVNALVKHYGIARDRLKPWGDGYTAPAAPNDTAADRSRNRRVELVREQ